MENKKFSVGDRVSWELAYRGTLMWGKGTVKDYTVGNVYLVEGDVSGIIWTLTPRQLRRLVKKPRREWWMCPSPSPFGCPMPGSHCHGNENCTVREGNVCIRVVEKRGGK